MNTPPLDTRFANARASAVNRTHRVIRAEALTLQEQKRRKRDLWVPIAIVSSLLIVCCYSMWSLLSGYDITPSGIPDASDQLFLLLLWSLPVTLLILGIVWFKRARSHNGEVPR